MPLRLRITLLFTFIVFFILGMVGTGVYYISYTERINRIETRLENRSITTARLLSQSAHFSPSLIQKIDSSTALTMQHKTVQAYDYLDRRFYSFSDSPADTLAINADILDEARIKGKVFFNRGDRDAVAYHYTDAHNRFVLVAAAYDFNGRQNLRELFYILLASLIGGLLITFISGWIFSRRLLSPLSKITSEVKEISAQNIARRIPTGHIKDEWFALTETFNQLLGRLQESFEMQQRFIANASHELSTPLTSVSSQLEVALLKERNAEDYKKVLQSVHQDVRVLSKLTQTLLEFAKASGTAAGLEIQPVRIDEIILRLPSEMSKVNQNYSVKLLFDNLPNEQEQLLVIGNNELLFTALRNIVMNACKFSHNAGAVLSFSVTDKVTIRISDKGPGIAEEKIKNIFEPFYRADESRNTEGFGLGLSLANRIIKLHKGHITIESEKGVGTNFIIQLPLADQV